MPEHVEGTERPDLDTFLRRQAEISAESFGADDPDVARFVEIRELLAERDTLLTEREELREALERAGFAWDAGSALYDAVAEYIMALDKLMVPGRDNYQRGRAQAALVGKLQDVWDDARSVLSSRETTDSPEGES